MRLTASCGELTRRTTRRSEDAELPVVCMTWERMKNGLMVLNPDSFSTALRGIALYPNLSIADRRRYIALAKAIPQL